MALRIKKAIHADETSVNGFIWTSENDPTWLRYQADLETGAMKGYHISKCEDALPRVTPFLYKFVAGHIAASYHYAVALAIMADIGKEILFKEDIDFIEETTVEQVNAWQDFMGAFDDQDASIKTGNDATETRYITYDKNVVIPSTLTRMTERGNLSMPRGRSRGFEIGARLSGFKAFDLLQAKGRPKDLKLGSIGDLNIAQAKEALKHVERPSSNAVAWYGTMDAEKAKYRMQAAVALPILAGMIADRHSLSTAIDEVRPMNPIVMEITGLGKASVKRIGKIRQAAPAGRIFDEGERIDGEDALGVNRARHTKISGSVATDIALRYLSELGPDRTPMDDESWLRFNDILAAVAIPLHNATSIPIADILEAGKGNWVSFHATLAKAADFEPEAFDRRTMALVTIDALEAIDHFSRTAILPQALASIQEMEQPEPIVSREFVTSSIEAATNIIIGKTKNIALVMMEISRRYASRIPAMMEIEGKSTAASREITSQRFGQYSEDEFPTLTGDFLTSNGFMIRPMGSGDMLIEESRRLQHCVGHYKMRARNMESHIYSVQSIDGSESFSTFEFGRVSGDDARAAAASLRIIQHRGRSNATPVDTCKAAKKEFHAALKSGAEGINMGEIAGWRNWLAEQNPNIKAVTHTNWKSVLELDWEDEDARLAYWHEWGQVLGGRVEKSPHPGAVYSEKKAQELVGAMSPRAAFMMIDQARQTKEKRETEIQNQDTPQP